jgi:hypothetical protein
MCKETKHHGASQGATIKAPADLDSALGPLPQYVRVIAGARGKDFDIIVLFVILSAEIELR